MAEYRVIGKALRKVDAVAKVTGTTRFADDLAFPRMLYCKLLRSTEPHARIGSIDTAAAASLEGVHAILTGRDLPIPFGILPVSQDEHTLCVDKVRFIGDPVAAVAATSEEVATAALDLIKVVYEPLKSIASAEEAVAHPEPRIHDYGDGGNLHKLIDLEFGDADAGIAAGDIVREDLFFFEGSTHLPMEQHAAVAMWSPDGKLTLWTSTQTPHYVHRAVAKVLELAPARIRVIATPNGGGFGGKSDPFNHEIAVAKLAMLTGRPVKITLTREEVPSRPSSYVDVGSDGCEARRVDHRHAFPVAARRRRVWVLRRGEHVLHGRTPDRHVSRAALSLPGRAGVHEQSTVRAEARSRHAAATFCRRSSSRQNRGAAGDRSGGAAPQDAGTTEFTHR